MKRAAWFTAGIVWALATTVLAATGGIPSLLRLQALFVSGQRPSIANCVTASCFEAGSGSTGAVGAQLAMTNASAGLNAKVWDNYVDNTGVMHYRLINDALGAATDWLTVSRTAHTSAQLSYLTQSGGAFNLPKFSYGVFTANASACALNGGVWQSQNISGCVRNSTGIYTVSFSNAYSGSPNSPVCFANLGSTTAGIAGVNTAGNTSVTVQTVTTAFATSDVGGFYVMCVGT